MLAVTVRQRNHDCIRKQHLVRGNYFSKISEKCDTPGHNSALLTSYSTLPLPIHSALHYCEEFAPFFNDNISSIRTSIANLIENTGALCLIL